MPRLLSRTVPFLLVVLGLAAAEGTLDAQASTGRSQIQEQPGQSRIALPADFDERRAEDIRTEFRKLLERYPPTLARVIKMDPTLMTNATYIAPYPALAAFIQRHPEVPRYAGYFMNFVGDDGSGNWQQAPQDPAFQLRNQSLRMWNDMMAGTLVLIGFVTAFITLARLVRYFISHRRWLRASKLQSDVNNRLLERFSSSDELMAYVQSPAGSQFLKGAPMAPDMPSQEVAAPFGRILWSVQAGVVLASAGVGFLFIRHYVMEEVSQMILVMGVLGISLGTGFALAAAASYALSHRLGLFTPAADRRGDSGSV